MATRKDLIVAVRDITETLHTAEGSLDVTMTDFNKLMNVIIQSRQGLGLSGCVTADAVVKVTEAVAALGAAHRATTQAHEALTTIAMEIPGWFPSPKTGVASIAQRKEPLRAVS